MLSYDDILFKPEWMRPPSWRWLASDEYLADPTKNVKEIKSDRVLIETVNFKRLLKNHNDNPRIYWKRHPHLAAAFQIYLKTMHDSWRWVMEAYLMTDLSDEEIAKRMKTGISPAVVMRYRKLFFDIGSYRESEAAVTANLLATSKVKATATGVSDYTWKLFAYVWGPDAFEVTFLPHKIKPAESHIDWLRTVSARNLDAHSFQLTASMREMYNEEAMGIVNTAKQYWDISKKETDDLEQQSKKQFLDTLSRSINTVLMSAPAKSSNEFSGDSNVFSKKSKEDK